MVFNVIELKRSHTPGSQEHKKTLLPRFVAKNHFTADETCINLIQFHYLHFLYTLSDFE